MEVKIRFNTDWLKETSKPDSVIHESLKKWRVIVGDVEHLVDEVVINCNSITTTDNIFIDNKEVEKYHVSCRPKSVSFITKKGQLKAILK